MLKAVDLLAQIALLPEDGAASWHGRNEGVVVEVVSELEWLRTGKAEGAEGTAFVEDHPPSPEIEPGLSGDHPPSP